MGGHTEKELYEIMRENLRLAVEACREIASQWQSGPQFIRLRDHLKKVEESCRDTMWLREDSRWSEVSLKFEQCHQIARRWLHHPSVISKKSFLSLGAALGFLLMEVTRLYSARTQRMGMILPEVGKVISHIPPARLVGVTEGLPA